MAQEFHPGQLVRLTCSFYVGTTLTDPTGVNAKVMGPDGVVDTFAYPGNITKDGVGIYHIDTTVDAEGTWHWRWWSTGTAQAADEGNIEVTRSPFV